MRKHIKSYLMQALIAVMILFNIFVLNTHTYQNLRGTGREKAFCTFFDGY